MIYLCVWWGKSVNGGRNWLENATNGRSMYALDGLCCHVTNRVLSNPGRNSTWSCKCCEMRCILAWIFFFTIDTGWSNMNFKIQALCKVGYAGFGRNKKRKKELWALTLLMLCIRGLEKGKKLLLGFFKLAFKIWFDKTISKKEVTFFLSFMALSNK